MYTNCFEIEYGDVYWSPLSHDISIVWIGALITQICENEKVVRFFLLALYTHTMYIYFAYNYSWEEVVEYSKSVLLGAPPIIMPQDKEASQKLCHVPPNWSLDTDEDLGQFMCHHLDTDNEHLGSIKNYVESIKVSSSSVCFWELLSHVMVKPLEGT